MRIVRRTLAVCLTVLLLTPSVQAQQHVVTTGELSQTVQQRASQERADRDAIAALLQRDDVRKVAADAGVSIEKAQAGVAMLQGDDLRQLASTARQVESDLAGGASTVVISTTTIIIALLLIVIIILIAD
jgi:hypothetical protein